MEFLSILIAVITAFALNNWNENRRDNQASNKILVEISNGLNKDLEDIDINMAGHEEGIKSCKFWRKVLSNQKVNQDSLRQYYLSLTRDFFSAQNISGYETLKSRGLELLKNDSLRFDIISLYEYDYVSLKTMEENYYEMQFQENYFKEFNRLIAPYFEFDDKGEIVKLNTPLSVDTDVKKVIFSYLWKIEKNREFIIAYYASMEHKIDRINERIKKAL